MKTILRLLLGIGLLLSLVGAIYLFSYYSNLRIRTSHLYSWLRDPESHPAWKIAAGTRCRSAPFSFPTGGMVGFLWDDSFKIGVRHQGIDIFGAADAGTVPVYAAYSGYLTREDGWKSSLIIRVPVDPLEPGRQIWLYYTHLADPQGNSFISTAFPPGTTEVYVAEGNLLGYQGNYSGDPGSPTGVHLHFSIVQDDGTGSYRNELNIHNTLDPSPYFNLPLDGPSNRESIPTCTSTSAVDTSTSPG